MKLNHECIRDLLLYLEDKLLITSHLCANDIEIAPFKNADVIYTVAKLSEANYIKTSQISYSNETIPTFHIQSLTWDGHKFLDNIRDDNVWEKTKSVVAQFSSVSIGIIEDVSNRIIVKMIDENL
jgi:hypothetical protein